MAARLIEVACRPDSLQPALYLPHKASRRQPVEGAVVEGQAGEHHRSNGDAVVPFPIGQHYWSFDDRLGGHNRRLGLGNNRRGDDGSHGPGVVHGERRPTQIGGLHSPRYAQAALEDELAKVASATEGTRNDTLNIAALSLGQLCAAGLLDEGEVSLMLCDVAQYAGLPITEIRATIRSGMRAGAANPRSVL